jgi:bifunctional DNA-binding transcriptional regulator/antitoxin component of YhaV-PrlF toxin-antitoxin module
MTSLVGIDMRTIDDKGRIVLPRFWLNALKLKEGMYVTVQLNEIDNSLRVAKARIDT